MKFRHPKNPLVQFEQRAARGEDWRDPSIRPKKPKPNPALLALQGLDTYGNGPAKQAVSGERNDGP